MKKEEGRREKEDGIGWDGRTWSKSSMNDIKYP